MGVGSPIPGREVEARRAGSAGFPLSCRQQAGADAGAPMGGSDDDVGDAAAEVIAVEARHDMRSHKSDDVLAGLLSDLQARRGVSRETRDAGCGLASRSGIAQVSEEACDCVSVTSGRIPNGEPHVPQSITGPNVAAPRRDH